MVTKKKESKTKSVPKRGRPPKKKEPELPETRPFNVNEPATKTGKEILQGGAVYTYAEPKGKHIEGIGYELIPTPQFVRWEKDE